LFRLVSGEPASLGSVVRMGYRWAEGEKIPHCETRPGVMSSEIVRRGDGRGLWWSTINRASSGCGDSVAWVAWATGRPLVVVLVP